MKQKQLPLAQHLRQALEALACQHAGEMLLSVAKNEFLGARSAAPVSTSLSVTPVVRVGKRKLVVLAVDSQMHTGALRYALSACERLDADLEVLTNLPQSDVARAIEQERPSGEGAFSWRVVDLGPDLFAGIAEHARRQTNTLFVVTSGVGRLAEKFVTMHPDAWRASVPWLLVSDDLRAA